MICALFWYSQAPASTIEQRLNQLVLYIASLEALLVYRSIRYVALATMELPGLTIRASGVEVTFTTLKSGTSVGV